MFNEKNKINDHEIKYSKEESFISTLVLEKEKKVSFWVNANPYSMFPEI